MKQPVRSAQSVAEGMLEKQSEGRASLSVDDVFTVVDGFHRVGFGVPDSADSDGFLFQYGVANWLAEPAFSISFVRQLEIVDSGGKHEDYLQVQFEFRYRVDSDLRALESHSSWRFDDGSRSFGE